MTDTPRCPQCGGPMCRRKPQFDTGYWACAAHEPPAVTVTESHVRYAFPFARSAIRNTFDNQGGVAPFDERPVPDRSVDQVLSLALGRLDTVFEHKQQREIDADSEHGPAQEQSVKIDAEQATIRGWSG